MVFDEFKNLYEMITSLSKKDMVDAFNGIAIPERKIFLKFLQEQSQEAYYDFIDDMRDIAVQKFWNAERDMIQQGECTRDWTPEQIEVILNISKETGMYRKNANAAMFLDRSGKPVRKNHGSDRVNEVYEGHQMLSVDKYPEHAGDCRNMQALGKSNGEHMKAHKGDYSNSSCWYYDYENDRYCSLMR